MGLGVMTPSINVLYDNDLDEIWIFKHPVLDALRRLLQATLFLAERIRGIKFAVTGRFIPTFFISVFHII